MLRPRTPQSLGFDLNDIPIVGPVISDVGKLLTGDICGALPVNIIPGLKDLVSKVGCTPAGRDALAVYLTSQGGPVVGAVGVGTMVSCLCSGKYAAQGIPVQQPQQSTMTSVINNPLTWVGVAAVILALVVTKSKKADKVGIPITSTTTFAPATVTGQAMIVQE